MQTNTALFLKRSFLFGSLSEKELTVISSFCSQKKLSKNHVLFNEGDDANSFYMIVYGKLKIYKINPEGKEHIIHLHSSNEIIAEAAIFDKKYYPASCKAVDSSMVIQIPKKDFVELIKNNPSISLKFMSAYSKRLREFVSTIEELSSSDVKKRLARYIINNIEVTNNKGSLKLHISKKELASMLGTVPETISRSLAHLKENGLISIKSKDIYVPDANKIKNYLKN